LATGAGAFETAASTAFAAGLGAGNAANASAGLNRYSGFNGFDGFNGAENGGGRGGSGGKGGPTVDVDSPNAARARWNALDFGVVASETVDSTAALQRALNVAGEAGGGVVELPSGRFRFDGTLTIPTGVTLAGTYRVAPSVVEKDEKPTGTTLLTYANRGKPDAAPFIELKGSNSALVGVVVTYPEWRQTDVPPVPYPPCVASENSTAVAVVDCCLLNPYEGIRFHLAHRHLVRNVTGYPCKRGLYVDECYDIGRIENIHFWPFGLIYKPDDPFCEWININGVAFEFARTDWHYVTNTFCFGYGRGYSFIDAGKGGANGNFLGIGADSCRRAVVVDQSQKQGLLITNGEFVGRWTSEDSVCLEIGERNEGAVMLTNCSFWGPVKTCVLSNQPLGRVTLNSCVFVNWDEVHSAKAKNGAPAIQIDAGRATIQGCSFEKSGTHVLVSEKAANVVAVGNQAPGGFRLIGPKSAAKVQTAANELDPMTAEPDAKENYRFALGTTNDARFVDGWFNAEKDGEGRTFRWSSGESRLTLPVVPGRRYRVAVELDAPADAVPALESEKTENPEESAEVGLFCEGVKVGEIVRGANRIAFETDVPADVDELTLAVRCRAWIPAEVREGSDDPRKLGVCGFAVEAKAVDADVEKTFDANFGVWRDGDEAVKEVNER
ncbi:MAG: hypothetical protein IKK39_11740, partial [Thermoguttaceae bacterium]|nr:hypothetical protein [Thermoguttaceae bacterium]